MTKILSSCAFFILSLVIFATSQDTWATGPKCEEALRNSDLFLRDVRSVCEALKHCLVRRDTCVSDGLPNTQSKCENVDECMGNRGDDFGDSARCRYQWTLAPHSTSTFKCSLKRKLFAAQDCCPGRGSLAEHGVIGTVLLRGNVINISSDSSFNCEAVKSYFDSLVNHIEKMREKVVKFCPHGNERASSIIVPACLESSDFTPQPDGRYALPAGASNGTRVRDGRNGSGTGHDGGGEESGGGGGPKARSR